MTALRDGPDSLLDALERQANVLNLPRVGTDDNFAFPTMQVNLSATKHADTNARTALFTWLEVGHYWQVTIDEEQMYLKQCLTYLYCTKLTHLLVCKRLGHYYTF